MKVVETRTESVEPTFFFLSRACGSRPCATHVLSTHRVFKVQLISTSTPDVVDVVAALSVAIKVLDRARFVVTRTFALIWLISVNVTVSPVVIRSTFSPLCQGEVAQDLCSVYYERQNANRGPQAIEEAIKAHHSQLFHRVGDHVKRGAHPHPDP